MAAPQLPGSLLQRIRDGKPIVVVAPGLAGPPWSEPVARLVGELADGYGVEVVGDGGPGGDAAERAAIAWLWALREACRGERVTRETRAASTTSEDDEAAAAARHAAATGSWDALVEDAARWAQDAGLHGDGPRAARWWTRVGGWYATKLGDLEAAMQAYEVAVAADPGAVTALAALAELYGETGSTEEHRQAMARLTAAVERDPDNLGAALGLAAALVAEAETAGDSAAPAAWREVDRRYRDILARHRVALSEAQTTEIWLRLGQVARTLGDAGAAEAALRRVVERAPLHAAARQALVDLAEARADWRAAIELRQGELDALASVPDSAPRRARLSEQIGDGWLDRLADTGAAIAAYQQAHALAPARGLLHKLLEAFTQQRKWQHAIDILDQLAAGEATGERRARFRFAAAMIARDELADGALAIAKLTGALDDDAVSPGAFDALEDLYTARGEWKPLARAYRQQLNRLGDRAPVRQLELWLALGRVCSGQLADDETAIAAYQVVCELAPDDVGHREQLAELYLAAGAPRRRDAIAELQLLLAAQPGRIELYKALAELYAGEREHDKAWCVAQVLVVLDAASADEARRFARGKRHGLATERRLTDDHWQAIAHAGEDRRIGAVFAAGSAAVAQASAQPLAAFQLDPAARVELASDPRPASRIVAYAAGVLAIDPPPMLWLDDGDGLRLANTLAPAGKPGDGKPGDGKPRPALMIGAAVLAKASPSELAFEVGKRLAYLRPERFAAIAAGTAGKLEAAYATAHQASGATVLALGDDERRTRLAAWRSATDLTANRAGLVIADDLAAAVRAIATEGSTLSGLPAKDRIRDLLAFAASERYFAIRRHLGQRAAGEADSPELAPEVAPSRQA